MSEHIEVAPTVVEAPVEQKYTYQPTDETGRPIGAPQVIKYTTVEELQQKLTEQNILLIRKLREQTKKVRLGIDEREEIGDDVPRFAGPVEFSPRDLSDEELYDISRRLADPTTSSAAVQELVEAKLGASLDAIGKTIQADQQELIALKAKYEVNAFKAENPDYYMCRENHEAITSWMLRYDLAPIKDNFQKAYDTLRAQGLLVEGAAPAPVVIPEPVVEPVVPTREELPVEPVVEVAPVRLPPTGLTREQTSDAGTLPTPGSDISYAINGQTLTGLAAIAAMPSEEYKRRLLHDRNFGKAVDQLEAAARKKG